MGKEDEKKAKEFVESIADMKKRKANNKYEKELSEKMYQATLKIYESLKGIPTIATVGLLDAIM